MHKPQIESLGQFLRQNLADPRRPNRTFPCGSLLVLVAMALFAGRDSLAAIQRYGQFLTPRQRTWLGFPCKPGTSVALTHLILQAGESVGRIRLLLAILCALLASCGDGDGAQDTTRGQATSSLAAPPTENPSALRPESATAPDTMAEEQLPEYELVRKNDADQGHISAIRINAVVSGQITEGGLRRLLLKLLAEANSTASQQRVFLSLIHI